MKVRFEKWEGLGNDFIVLRRDDLDPVEVARLCDRRRGIGADGVLLVSERAGRPRMIVRNADGSRPEMCGNGLRCVVKHLGDHTASHPESLTILTGAGPLTSALHYARERVERVTVSMGPARLEAPNLPPSAPLVNQPFEGLRATAVNMGNPHLVLMNAELSQAGTLGPTLETHPAFAERTNVEFVKVTGPRSLEVVVWERGVGLTLACGTGACAAVVAFALNQQVPFDEWVTVKLPGGELRITVARDLSSVQMNGPVSLSFEGTLP